MRWRFWSIRLRIIYHRIHFFGFRLKILNLESNKFGDKGCKIITESLAASKSILHLNLSKNNLTSKNHSPYRFVLGFTGIPSQKVDYNPRDVPALQFHR